MIKVGIIGISGYTGLELAKILLNHPEVELVYIAGSQKSIGKPISDFHSSLYGISTLICESIASYDFHHLNCVFLATPNEVSVELIPKLYTYKHLRIIDLSGAFRLKDESLYPTYYGFENPHDHLLKKAKYSIPELQTETLTQHRFIANPGCYPTSVQLAVIPLLSEKMINVQAPLIIDSKSGVSGAGRKVLDEYLYTEVNESVMAYGVHKHRHHPEILQQLQEYVSISEDKVIFTPHLVPLSRGMLSTIYLTLNKNSSVEAILEIWRKTYQDKKCIKVLPAGILPKMKDVSHTPYCQLGCSVKGTSLIAVSTIDNLLKGAASQAVQNMNLLFGLHEAEGIGTLS